MVTDGDTLMACSPSSTYLNLTCPEDSVVTANVFESAEQVGPVCVYNGSQCLNTTRDGLECLWHKSTCIFRVKGSIMKPPAGCHHGLVTYLVALDFKCVAGNQKLKP